MMDIINEENDIISKLLNEDNTMYNVNNVEKSLHDELQEAGELSGRKKCPKEAGFNLKQMVDEFQSLSVLMDDEIAARHEKDQKQEPAQCVENPAQSVDGSGQSVDRSVQSVDGPIQSVEEYENKIRSLKEALNRQKNVNFELQNEFNKVLNEKEEEIEELHAQNYDLQIQLQESENSCNAIAMENEELEDKVEIKDEYIASLRLQINRLEKQHDQDLWRLSQSDDLLEMLEKDQSAEAKKYKDIISNLVNSLCEQSPKRREPVVKTCEPVLVACDPVFKPTQLVNPPPGLTSINIPTENLLPFQPPKDLNLMTARDSIATTPLAKDLTQFDHVKKSPNSLSVMQQKQEKSRATSGKKTLANCKTLYDDDRVLTSLGWDNNKIKNKRTQ